MARTVYVNGAFVAEADAVVSVFDRGFLMADGVYEVTAVLDGRLVDFHAHLARLHRSMDALEMAAPSSDEALLAMHRELVARNRLTEGLIYLQVTRGNPGDRGFIWPEHCPPTVVAFTQAVDLIDSQAARAGLKVISVEDIRWHRRDIKTVQLLAPSWAKMQAKSAGKDDAWLVEDGQVNEGTSNNAWIVTETGNLVTRQLSRDILHGITRAAVLAYAREAGVAVEERPFSIAEAQGAAEAFITSASNFVCPVVEVDGQPVGNGQPGPVTKRLRALYIDSSRDAAI